jgi:type IV secretory pathway TraG/TraD family ATPase VirD4
MTEIYEKNACILVIINAQSYADFAYELGALVIQDIKKLIGHISSLGKSDRKHTLVVFDELGTYLSDEVLHIYNKGRSAGIQAVGMVQSLSDLEKNSPLLKNQIIENCNIFISFRTNDPDGADQISKIFGTEDSLEITHKIDGPYKSGSGTAKLVDKFKVHPNAIKELPDNVGYVYVKGENSDQKPLRFTNRFVSYK